MITVRTADGVPVEVTHSDVGFAPRTTGQLSLNTTAVWVKVNGQDWIRSGHRSAMKTCDIIKHSNAAELAEKLR